MLIILSLPGILRAQPILIEAENFENKGGWFVDPQFYDQMGSFYLLAHGNGEPVQNAVTHFKADRGGRYFVYVRTRNWVAHWFADDAHSPGIFRIAVNGTGIPCTMGNKGKEWAWHYAGETMLNRGLNKLELIDLTGFDGRCDALLFTKNKNDKILRSSEELEDFRKSIFPRNENGKKYDLIVTGGGVAGLAAAISAARFGLKTCLIHNRPVLGGNNSVEHRVVASGKIMQPPYFRIGKVVREIVNIYENPGNIDKLVEKEKNLDLFLNTQVVGVEMEGNIIRGVIAKNIENNREMICRGELFADCTGDGNVGFYAGAEYMMGRETRMVFNESLAPENESNLGYGSTLKWTSKKVDSPVGFPELPWAVQFTDLSCFRAVSSSWYWETGFSKNQIDEAEYIRDYMLRVIYGNWAFLKNAASTGETYRNYRLSYVSPVLGRRESRRLTGDVVFTQKDVEGRWKEYDDACVVGTYTIDQHVPEQENSVFFPGNEFISDFKHNYSPVGVDVEFVFHELKMPPYYIPYRCLYSKNISNLFMAGRNISCSRIAFCSSRVQGTTGMMGEVVGIAACLCRENNCHPRAIYREHSGRLKAALLEGVPGL